MNGCQDPVASRLIDRVSMKGKEGREKKNLVLDHMVEEELLSLTRSSQMYST
jgi:hypothetical protein